MEAGAPQCVGFACCAGGGVVGELLKPPQKGHARLALSILIAAARVLHCLRSAAGKALQRRRLF